MSSDKYLKNCNFIKTILMLMVLVYHCAVFWTGRWFTCNPCIESSVLGHLATWLDSIHVYGFALVSGYIFYHLRYETNRYDAFLPFIIKKAKRLIIPYFFVLFVWVVPLQVALKGGYSLQDCVKDFILGFSPNQLWFLLMLFWEFVIFYCLGNVLNKLGFTSYIIIVALYFIGLFGSNIIPNYFQIWRALTMAPIFGLGFMLRKQKYVIPSIPGVMWLVLQIGSYIFLSWLEGSMALPGYIGRIVLLLKQGLGAFFIFNFLQVLANYVNWENSLIFLQFKRKSMPIYLVHQQLIYIPIILLNGIVHPLVHFTVNCVFSLLTSFVLSSVLLRWASTRMLIGEK